MSNHHLWWESASSLSMFRRPTAVRLVTPTWRWSTWQVEGLTMWLRNYQASVGGRAHFFNGVRCRWVDVDKTVFHLKEITTIVQGLLVQAEKIQLNKPVQYLSWAHLRYCMSVCQTMGCPEWKGSSHVQSELPLDPPVSDGWNCWICHNSPEPSNVICTHSVPLLYPPVSSNMAMENGP